MIIAIDDSSDIPIYQQIRNQIVLGISDGRLLPGEQLPTVRALAQEAGINSMTVNKAYQLLKQEGYIVANGRNGARVRDVFAGRQGLTREARDTLARVISEAKIGGMSERELLELCARIYRGNAD